MQCILIHFYCTFNGTIPGPVISVDQGDTLEITLKNKGNMVHSLDFNGISGPSQALSGYISPGRSKTWKMKADNVGVFMYHCDGDNLNGIWEHIADGMYGCIVVHRSNEKPAKEFYMVFGEIYNTADSGLFIGTKGKIGSFDLNKFIANKPDLVLTNGMAYKYLPMIGALTTVLINENAQIFKIKPGELTRWYIVNAGPRGHVTFNFAAGMINVKSSIEGSNSISNNSNKSNTNNNNINRNSDDLSKIYETSIPPGSASII